MHELAIAQNILQIAQEEISSRNLEGDAETILFRAGRLNAVIPDILIFNFDVLKMDVLGFRETTLKVEQDPIRVKCKSCDQQTVLEEPVFVCMVCGGSVEVESGQDMFVERIVMKGSDHGN